MPESSNAKQPDVEYVGGNEYCACGERMCDHACEQGALVVRYKGRLTCGGFYSRADLEWARRVSAEQAAERRRVADEASENRRAAKAEKVRRKAQKAKEAEEPPEIV